MERIENILICGNGPSARNIDFRRVPKDSKIFRMTSFYFEDKYYAGNKVDFYLNYVKRLDNSYFDLHYLQEKGEYQIDMSNIWMTVMFEKNEYFPTVKMATPLIQEKLAIAEFRYFYQYYYGQYLPTGMQAIPLAAMLGFKNIYLTGYDFFSDPNNLHIYPGRIKKGLAATEKERISSSSDIYDTKSIGGYEFVTKTHPTELQIKFLLLLREVFPEANLFSVSEESLINQYIDLAPLIYDASWHISQPKPPDSLQDYLPLPETMPSRTIHSSK